MSRQPGAPLAGSLNLRIAVGLLRIISRRSTLGFYLDSARRFLCHGRVLPSAGCSLAQPLLDLLPELPIQYRLVLPRVAVALVTDLTHVNGVGE